MIIALVYGRFYLRNARFSRSFHRLNGEYIFADLFLSQMLIAPLCVDEISKEVEVLVLSMATSK
jgi:hypothetical protein